MSDDQASSQLSLDGRYCLHYKKASVIKREEEEEEEEERGREKARVPPRWIKVLLRSKFFGVCEEHKEARKSEENIYRVDCGRRVCPHCLARPGCPHRAHRHLQIRRYVYQDVVRAHRMQKLLNRSIVWDTVGVASSGPIGRDPSGPFVETRTADLEDLKSAPRSSARGRVDVRNLTHDALFIGSHHHQTHGHLSSMVFDHKNSTRTQLI
ncbi:PLATZ transcription factor [Musa troglodytarum]|uniref:PLATZ transcription factor n=1 Tax=Musa troglodytarum TaxID=320322 RepID=A0A9E7L7X9_9LILI|nr:PLATZ transcription factor [Musa troglodytarum]